MIDDRLISNDFFNYNFEGYELRSDQIIDFGDGLNAESLIFTTFKGVDWMEANYSHYFQVKHWKVDQTFEEVVTGPSWFTHFHDEIADRHQEYFYTESGYPAYLVISWRKNDKIAGDFYDYFYSLLIDGTTENYRHLEKQSYFLGSKPWVEVWMQSLVGVGSNLPVSRKLSEITGMIKEIANKVVITGGIPKSQVDRENFDLMATNSSPFSFINSMSLGNKWEFSEWLGTFYKSRPNWIYHENLGWFYYEKSTASSSWCWSSVFDWFWISQDTYPYVFLDSGKWLYLDRNSKVDSLLVYDFEQKKWTGLSMITQNLQLSFQDQIQRLISSFKTEDEKKEEIARFLILGK